jgi:proteasome alpha subunit
MPFYMSAEQVMRDRSELARKGISRGRSVVVMQYADGVLFVAENPSPALHKISELYDRIGFGAVGRYNELENLRTAGIRWADLRGYSYDRRDVTGRSMANWYAQLLGAIFSQEQKPYEVELCVAAVSTGDERDDLYRVTYDGSLTYEPDFVVMGGQTEPVSTSVRRAYQSNLPLADAIRIAVTGLGASTPGASSSSSSSSSSAAAAKPRTIPVSQLEVAVLERARPRRAFRRITGAALAALMPAPPAEAETPAADKPAAGSDKPADGGAKPTNGAKPADAAGDTPEASSGDTPAGK